MRLSEDKRTGTPRREPSPMARHQVLGLNRPLPTTPQGHQQPRPWPGSAGNAQPRREEPKAGCAYKIPSASGRSAASVRGGRRP